MLAIVLVACGDPVLPDRSPACGGPVYTSCYTIDRVCCQTDAENLEQCWYERDGIEYSCAGVDCSCAMARLRVDAGLCPTTGDTGTSCD